MTVEDAGKYKVTAKNELGESNATISLNFDSKLLSGLRAKACDIIITRIRIHIYTLYELRVATAVNIIYYNRTYT